MKIQSAKIFQRKPFGWLAIAMAVGALAACSGGSTASKDAAAAAVGAENTSAAPQVAMSVPSASAPEFPNGTALGDLGLPVYPTPPEHIAPHDVGTNGDGEKYDSVLLEPHDPFDTVVAWYKAHMPAGSSVASMNPKHAEFHIDDGDKVTRMVIIDNIHEGQTHLILMVKRKP